MNEYPDVYATEGPEFPEESIGEPPEEESKYVDWAFLANCGVDEEEEYYPMTYNYKVER